VVEDPAAARLEAHWLWIHSDTSSVAMLLRVAFQAQSRSVRRFGNSWTRLVQARAGRCEQTEALDQNQVLGL